MNWRFMNWINMSRIIYFYNLAISFYPIVQWHLALKPVHPVWHIPVSDLLDGPIKMV